MNLESALKWFYDRLGRVTYSMAYRNGPSSYDCSSTVYYALIQGGFLPAGHRIGNTDSLYGDLEKSGWTRTNNPKRGDIFLWGTRGASGGAAGHTGQFVSSSRVIHCAYGYNGIHEDDYNQLAAWNGRPVQTFYTYTGKPYAGDTDQSVDPGSTIRFDKAFSVNDVQLIGGIWQIYSKELCPIGFTWDDNGIPAEPVYEVDADGYATADQSLETGSKFVIPGKFTVLDVGEYQGRWLALISWGIYSFWVDLEPATEIKATDPGKAVPGNRPATPKPPATPIPVPETPKPVEPEKPVEPTPEQPKPVEPQPETEQTTEPPTPPPVEPDKPKPVEPKKEDKPMAFTKEQQQELAISTQKVQQANGEFNPVVSEKAKTIAYFATDIGSAVSVFLLTVGAILGAIDGNTAIYLAAAVTTLMVSIKVTFRLSSKKQ